MIFLYEYVFFLFNKKKKKMLPISKSNNISCYFKHRLTRKKRLFVIYMGLRCKSKNFLDVVEPILRVNINSLYVGECVPYVGL